jgi:hypothetical protein
VTQICESRPVGLPAQSCNQIRSFRSRADQLALEACVLQITGKKGLRLALVAGRVDRVEADQPLQKRGCLVAKVRRGQAASSV